MGRWVVPMGATKRSTWKKMKRKMVEEVDSIWLGMNCPSFFYLLSGIRTNQPGLAVASNLSAHITAS